MAVTIEESVTSVEVIDDVIYVTVGAWKTVDTTG